MTKNTSAFYTFGSWIKRTKNSTVSISSTCYSSTKTGLTTAYEATKQAVNDTVEGYKSEETQISKDTKDSVRKALGIKQ